MERLIFATGNKDKLREIKEIMADTDYEIVSMKEAGINIDIVEDGSSFEENALIKARAIAKASGCLTLSDDSGLVIDYINGEPGIYSARYMGEDTPYDVKNTELIRRLENAEGDERAARFVCACAAVFPDGTEKVVTATMEGQIAYKIAGENGFGYDPILYLPEYGCNSAELSREEKNKISHRGKALRMMRDILKEM